MACGLFLVWVLGRNGKKHKSLTPPVKRSVRIAGIFFWRRFCLDALAERLAMPRNGQDSLCLGFRRTFLRRRAVCCGRDRKRDRRQRWEKKRRVATKPKRTQTPRVWRFAKKKTLVVRLTARTLLTSKLSFFFQSRPPGRAERIRRDSETNAGPHLFFFHVRLFFLFVDERIKQRA